MCENDYKYFSGKCIIEVIHKHATQPNYCSNRTTNSSKNNSLNVPSIQHNAALACHVIIKPSLF